MPALGFPLLLSRGWPARHAGPRLPEDGQSPSVVRAASSLRTANSSAAPSRRSLPRSAPAVDPLDHELASDASPTPRTPPKCSAARAAGPTGRGSARRACGPATAGRARGSASGSEASSRPLPAALPGSWCTRPSSQPSRSGEDLDRPDLLTPSPLADRDQAGLSAAIAASVPRTPGAPRRRRRAFRAPGSLATRISTARRNVRDDLPVRDSKPALRQREKRSSRPRSRARAPRRGQQITLRSPRSRRPASCAVSVVAGSLRHGGLLGRPSPRT